jgi:hypothetical protein
MGLSEPALVTPREKILDPRTGKPAGGSDPFFSQVNSELAHKGFLVAAADDLIHGSLRPAGRQDAAWRFSSRSLLCFTSHHVSILRIHATSSGLCESCP